MSVFLGKLYLGMFLEYWWHGVREVTPLPGEGGLPYRDRGICLYFGQGIGQFSQGIG